MRYNAYFFILLLALLYSNSVYSQDLTALESCQIFYNQLKEIPHTKLTLDSVIYKSLLNLKREKGCQVKFVTTDSISANVEFPAFTKSIKGTKLYDQGWRYNDKYTADGAGTGLVGIENRGVLCLISYARPVSSLKPGKFEISDDITIIVQCGSKKELGNWDEP